MAAAATVAVPTVAAAGQPAPPPAPPKEAVAALQALAPAIIGAAANTEGSAPNTAILNQAKALLKNADLPVDIQKQLDAVIAFINGTGGGGPAIPNPKDPNAPIIQQFLYPTIGHGCIGGTSDSVGTALLTAGPQKAPAPGPGPHQAGYVFTALGTNGAQPNPQQQLTVSWVNLDTRQTGSQPLTDSAHINPDGPTTLTTIANTGSGRIVSTIYGTVTSKGKDGKPPVSCSILPTVGLAVVK